MNKWAITDSDPKTFKNYFNSSNTPVQYKADINVYGKFFSGILFVKFLNDTTCHVAFTTIPGIKLFEIGLTPKSDTIYACFDKMNRPVILKSIKKNIRIFVMLDNYVKDMQSFKKEGFKGVIWRNYTSTELYQFYQPEGEPINKIELRSKGFNKRIILNVKYFKGNIPSDINIKNYSYNLSIHLTQ